MKTLLEVFVSGKWPPYEAEDRVVRQCGQCGNVYEGDAECPVCRSPSAEGEKHDK